MREKELWLRKPKAMKVPQRTVCCYHTFSFITLVEHFSAQEGNVTQLTLGRHDPIPRAWRLEVEPGLS